jgi:hypothetical protein
MVARCQLAGGHIAFGDMSLAQILEELPSLSSDERRQIIQRAAELEDALTPEDEAIVEARLAEHDRAPHTAIPLEQFTQEVRSRYGL